jgi:hypothetical protein
LDAKENTVLRMAMFQEPSLGLEDFRDWESRSCGSGRLGRHGRENARTGGLLGISIGTGVPGTPPVCGESAKIGKTGTVGRSGFVAVPQLAKCWSTGFSLPMRLNGRQSCQQQPEG